MLPLKDHDAPHVNSHITIGIIIITAIIFAIEFSAPDIDAFMQSWAMIPANISLSNPTTWYTFLTCVFLHGGIMHIVGNMWYLWIFGNNVETKLGVVKYILFYAAGGIIASLVQYFFDPSSTIPVVGASGAVAAVLGFYAVKFPKNKVTSIIPLGIMSRTIQLPSLIVLGFWFVLQLFNGTASITTVTADAGGGGGVAWWAHIGGFVFGMVIAAMSRSRRVR